MVFIRSDLVMVCSDVVVVALLNAKKYTVYPHFEMYGVMETLNWRPSGRDRGTTSAVTLSETAAAG